MKAGAQAEDGGKMKGGRNDQRRDNEVFTTAWKKEGPATNCDNRDSLPEEKEAQEHFDMKDSFKPWSKGK